IKNGVWDNRQTHDLGSIQHLRKVLESSALDVLGDLVSRGRAIAEHALKDTAYGGVLKSADKTLSPLRSVHLFEDIKQTLNQNVQKPVLLRDLPLDARQAVQVGLSALGVLEGQLDSSDIRGLERAWNHFKALAEANAGPARVDPGSIGLLLHALDGALDGAPDQGPLGQSSPSRRPGAVSSSTEMGWTDAWQVSSNWDVNGSNSHRELGTVSARTLHHYADFPKNFDFLGRCYDILTLDPLDTSGSAKMDMAFYFSHDQGERILGEKNLLKPQGTRHAPGAGGGLDVSSRTQILQTASDTQALFANTLGGGILALVGKFLPFSNSSSYQKFKTARTRDRSIYTVTKADYIDYSLALNPDSIRGLQIDAPFRAEVERLPATVSPEHYLTFINRFGTHVSTHVDFGGLAYRCIRLNESLYQELTQRGVDLQIEAAKLFDVGFSKQDQSVTLREISESSEVFRVNGGLPSQDWGAWFASIKEDPAPVKMDLMPLHELFTRDFFPGDSDIDAKRQLMEMSVEAYLEQNADKPRWEPWRSIPLGGHGGASFSDLDIELRQLAANKARYQLARAVEVKVSGGKCIDSVQMRLSVGDFDTHGSSGGSEQSLRLGDGEYIASVRVTEGRPSLFIPHCVTALEITTSLGHRLTVGTPTGPFVELDIPDNYQVIGFHGSCGRYIDRLGVIAAPRVGALDFDSTPARPEDVTQPPVPLPERPWDLFVGKSSILLPAEIQRILNAEVRGAMHSSQWPLQLIQAIGSGLIHLNLLNELGNRQAVLTAWKKFKASINQADPETIGPGSAQSLLQALQVAAVGSAPSNPGIPQQAIDLIKEKEGFRAKAYADPGHGWAVPTIGYGTIKYSPDGRPVQQGDIITREKAEECLLYALQHEFRPALESIPTWSRMNNNQRSALYSFAYNLGKGFYGDRANFNSMTHLCDSPQDWNNVSKVESVFKLYVNSNGRVLPGLVTRRGAEAALFCKPDGGNLQLPDGTDISRRLTQVEQRVINDPNPPLNVRSGPDSSERKVSSLPNETLITVVGEQNGWLQISEPVSGWVYRKFTREMTGGSVRGVNSPIHSPIHSLSL
ncbi:MAG: MAC/perforin domain-containing protein, partial [Cyanobacteria bacterium J06632_22]